MAEVESRALIDSFGRTITYLRLSLTEACNFRCVYCLPKEGFQPKPNSEHLTLEEILRVVGILGALGVRKVRLTGGEPLLRKDVVEIAAGIKELGFIDDLSLTTNGVFLSPLLAELKVAGLDRINISLDTLSPKRFAAVTLRDDFRRVFAAVMEALEIGFPLKLNTLLLKDLSEEEILRLVGLAVEHPLELRFLEFMPLCGEGWKADDFLPIACVRETVRRTFDLIADGERGDQVAETYRLRGGKGRVGFIASVTEPFCENCSRLRLTADGKIRPCLFSTLEFPLKDLLRGGADDEALAAAIRHAVARKPRGNHFYEAALAGTDPTRFRPAENSLIRALGG